MQNQREHDLKKDSEFISSIGYKNIHAKKPSKGADPSGSLLNYFYLDKANQVKSVNKSQQIVIEQGKLILQQKAEQLSKLELIHEQSHKQKQDSKYKNESQLMVALKLKQAETAKA